MGTPAVSIRSDWLAGSLSNQAGAFECTHLELSVYSRIIMYIYWYITRGIENKLFGERPVMEDAEGDISPAREGGRRGERGLTQLG